MTEERAFAVQLKVIGTAPCWRCGALGPGGELWLVTTTGEVVCHTCKRALEDGSPS